MDRSFMGWYSGNRNDAFLLWNRLMAHMPDFTGFADL
jgi:hypothetical protein